VHYQIVSYGSPVDDNLRLRHQVCFALYAASRSVTSAYRPLLEPLGLTYPQYLALLVLWERGDTSVKDLGAALMLDSGTLSPLLKRLEAAGLVDRRRRTDDERSVVISLTEQGARLRDRAGEIPATLAATTGMSPRQLSDLRDTLAALTTAVTAAETDPTTSGARRAPSPER
jgi:MarR family transcriptional regulator, organic hydroperoxide resistance regulator